MTFLLTFVFGSNALEWGFLHFKGGKNKYISNYNSEILINKWHIKKGFTSDQGGLKRSNKNGWKISQ